MSETVANIVFAASMSALLAFGVGFYFGVGYAINARRRLRAAEFDHYVKEGLKK